MARQSVAIISTGGTIEKTYDEIQGVLSNKLSNLDVMLASLELGDVKVVRVPLMNMDSAEMTEREHTLIAGTALSMAKAHNGVIIVHGTDTLEITGERIVEMAGDDLPVPVVLTGAMKPYELRSTDALQNLTAALIAVQLVEPGVYVAMHNKVLQFPGVVKDRSRGTFMKP